MLGFASTSLDNLAVLTLLFSARRLRPLRVGITHLAVCTSVSGLGWIAASLVESVHVRPLEWLGWIPIALGARAAWELWRPAPGRPARTVPGGEPAAALLLVATSVDNLLICLALYAHAPASLDLPLFAILAVCALLWGGLAFWLARYSWLAPRLQRLARPLLPLLLVGIGAWMLDHA